VNRRHLLGLLSYACLPLPLRLLEAAEPTAGAAPQTSSIEGLEPFCGLFRRTDGSTVGIERFINDEGKLVLLYSDNRTGDVRTLFARQGGEFAMVRGFDAAATAERTAQFDRDASDQVRQLRALSPGATRAEVLARVDTRNESVTFERDDARLTGTLIVPAGRAPHPAIILLHGSGPLTRYSFGPYPRFFSSLGLAVFFFDKRGTGASTGQRLDASSVDSTELWPGFYPDALRNDALAAYHYLKTRPDVDPRRIGCWGSSEGGMLSTQVAAEAADLAFAIDSSGFMGPLWETFAYQWGERVRTSAAAAEYTEAMAYFRFYMEVARTGSGWSDYVARRAALVRQGKLWVNAIDPPSLEQMRWAWDHILSFNPLPALSRVKCPVLGLWGENDPLTDVRVAPASMRNALAAGGNRNVTTRVFPNAGHSLMEQSDASRLAPGVFDTLREWLSSSLG